jgi:hypothetical protein
LFLEYLQFFLPSFLDLLRRNYRGYQVSHAHQIVGHAGH